MASSDFQSHRYWQRLIGQSVTRFLLLRILRSGPAYGYQLVRAMKDVSDEFVTPTEGAIYTALSDFAKHGLITVEERVVNGRTQRVYSMTEHGRAAFRTAATSFGRLLPLLRKLTTL